MNLNYAATLFFTLALVHTFSVNQFQKLAGRFPTESVASNFFHLLGEVEVVFGFWAGLFLLYIGFTQGREASIHYIEGLNFTEPAFVFVVMTICSTRPVRQTASIVIEFLARAVPLPRQFSHYFICLSLGPLLGSFVTEPAAMTVVALILAERYMSNGISERFKYATIGLLFVNVSIGGTLTSFAAPPVLMVAKAWNWDTPHMLVHFGWKAVLACTLSTILVMVRFNRELRGLPLPGKNADRRRVPIWLMLLHLFFLALVVGSSHYLIFFMWIFLFFLGLVSVTAGYQSDLKLREGLLVAFFLGGIVVLGSPQHWWLKPLLTQFDNVTLYLGSIGLTAVMDNAVLTYLGSLGDLGSAARYALVAGCVVGGGLTVVANAPNPAGYGILSPTFGGNGISAFKLFMAATAPTIVAALCFWLF